MVRRLGFRNQQRINGPDLMWRYCEQAVARGEAIYLYGGMPETLDMLRHELQKAFPGLRIAGAWSPPFRPLTKEEDEADVVRINASGAGTVWVGLGCPKQEQWMAAHRGRVQAVMIGVGAAFDYHAGKIKRAPAWMQDADWSVSPVAQRATSVMEALSGYEYALYHSGRSPTAFALMPWTLFASSQAHQLNIPLGKAKDQ